MKSRVSGRDPNLHAFDFDGACTHLGSADSISVGIFQWVPKASGIGLKRGTVVERLRATPRDREALFAKAQARCDELTKAYRRSR